MSEEGGPVRVALPRPVGRRLALGPFPSARDAMKFAAYAAVGTVALPLGGPIAWLPLLGAGFLVAVYRPDGKALDERASDYLGWRWRRRRGSGRGAVGPSHSASPATDWLRLPGPVAAAVVEARGVPIRFLPPEEARALFDSYRELLRSIGGRLRMRVEARPLRRADFRLPASPSRSVDERAAREGYAQLLETLLARRRVRTVHLLLDEPFDGPAAPERLGDRAGRLLESLGALGCRPERLMGRRLAQAVEAMGPTGAPGG